jgi:prepilin-type N-terminal cleavage/methylation domain-containing protein
MSKHIHTTKKGFTLLETLIAIAILTVAIGAAFGVAQKSLITASNSKNQTTAFFLAAEGLELVRDVRDNVHNYNATYLSYPIDWMQPFIDVCSKGDSTCTYDIDPLSAGLRVDAGTKKLVDTAGIIVSSDTASTCSDPSSVPIPLKIVPNSDASIPSYYTSRASFGTGNSIFSRKICIKDVTTDGLKEAQIQVTVTWLEHSFTLTDTLTDWQS